MSEALRLKGRGPFDRLRTTAGVEEPIEDLPGKVTLTCDIAPLPANPALGRDRGR